MNSLPRKTREQTIAEIQQARETAEIAHLGKVELLEDCYGITYDQLIDLYGESVLDVANPRAMEVDRLLSLCDTLATTEKSMVAVVGFAPNLPNHPCEPQLPIPRSDVNVTAMILTDPHNARVVASGDGTTACVSIVGDGYRLIQPTGLRAVEPTFDDLSAPAQPIGEIIVMGVARRNLIDTDLSGRLDLVVTGDTFGELYEHIVVSHNGKLDSTGDIEMDKTMRKLSYADYRRRLAAATPQSNT